MAEPTDDQHRSAQEIANRLFQVDEWLARPIPERVEVLPPGLSVHDIELHAGQFHSEAILLDTLGCDGFPAVELGHGRPVPVSLPVALPGWFDSSPAFWPGATAGDRRLLLRRYFALPRFIVKRLLDQLYELTDLVPLPRRESEQAFVECAAESLSHRIATAVGVDGEPPDGSTPTGTGGDPPHASTIISIPPTHSSPAARVNGCQFTVNTNTSGLRVFWSGAYYITSHFFGAPTTPAVGTLQSGTYIFGVDGGAYTNIQWDRTAVCSLPGQPSVHLNF